MIIKTTYTFFMYFLVPLLIYFQQWQTEEIFNGCLNLHTFFSAVLKGKPSVLLIAYLSFLNWVPLCCHAVYDYLRSKKMLLWCIMSFFPGGLNVCSRYVLVWISMIRYQSRDFLNLIVWWSMTINSTSQE